MITLENLTKIYRTDEVETTALQAVNLKIEKGEFVAIMGPSGCGKSTLLNVLGMLDEATSGNYIFNGTEVAGVNESSRAKIRKNKIGFIFQSFNLIEELTIFENIELPLLYCSIARNERKKMVSETMEKLGISHRSKHFPQQLSGGQQQRVAVARAVVAKPLLILADEPTGNLDSKNGIEVMQLLTELNDNETTIVMVTHSERDAGYSKRKITMMDGKIL